MITPKTGQSSAAVARHYDELDEFYRDIWGNHVHHGYWRTGRENPAEAAEALSHLVAERLDLKPGMILCDIGCGYGETARLLASDYSVKVKGVTVSGRQRDVASSLAAGGVSISLCDWLENDFAAQSFDRAYAIESSEHIADKEKFFEEAFRVLKPGGRFAICAWLASETATERQRRFLLEPICRQGRLPGMGSESEYRDMAQGAGFRVASSEDISAQVQRTWEICLRRLAGKLVSDKRYIRTLFSTGHGNRIFVLTMALILAAYRSGAMRYRVLVYDKPV